MSEYGPEIVGHIDKPFDPEEMKKLIEAVQGQNVSITVTYEPDRKEISISPWEPYKPTCPYGQKGEE